MILEILEILGILGILGILFYANIIITEQKQGKFDPFANVVVVLA